MAVYSGKVSPPRWSQGTIRECSQWEYPFLFVVIGLRKSCDTVVATEEQKRKQKLGGALLEKIFRPRRKRDTWEKLLALLSCLLFDFVV